MKRLLCVFLISMLSLYSCKNHKNETSITSELDYLITKENLALEEIHKEMLDPIISLKTIDPKTYWFIVSWLNTKYRTPVWDGYGSDDWKEKTKQRGIDCSGFSRVMQDQIFKKRIRGGSQGILNDYCIKKKLKDLELGDLVFFRAPYSKGNKITHMGVYLIENNFVHATSAKSAAIGLGLSINSLDEKIWQDNFIIGGSIK